MGRLGLPGFGLLARGTPRTPYLLPVPGAILHLRGDLGITTVGADVDIWRDQSGTGNHARPNALLFNRPEYQAAGGVSGTPGVSFQRGAVEGMDLSTMVNASNDYTVFAVVEQYNAHNATQVLLSTGVPAPGGDPFDPAVLVQTATTELGVTDNIGFISSDCPSMNDEQYLTWRMDSDSGTFDCYRNTLHLGTGAYDGTGRTFNTMTTLGCRIGGALYEADMVLSEIIVFPWALSPADRAAVDAYIDTRYAMAYTSIGSVEGGLAWFDAALGITETGAGVSEWLNQADTARNQVYAAAVDATQGTDIDRPAFSAAGGVNGLPAVDFDAANTEFMDLGALTDASEDYTVFAILTQTATANTQTLLGSAAAATIAASHTATLAINDGTAWRDMVTAMTGDQAVTWVLDSTATGVDVYRDFTLLGTDTYDATWGWANPELGKTPAGTDHLNALVSELIVFNRKLNDLELAAVHAELLAKFALAFSPLSVAGCAEWYRADTGITLNGADVAAWANQGTAGAARDIAQGVAGDQPLFVAGTGPGATDYIEFDGVSEYLRGTWVQAQPTHSFAVGLISATGTANDTMVDGSVLNRRRIYASGAAIAGLYCGAGLNVASSINAWHRYEALANGGASNWRVDDLAPSAGNAGAAAPGGLVIGAPGNLANFADSRVAEFMEYDRNTLTAEESTALHAYLTARYGI